MKLTTPTQLNDIRRKWYLVDVNDKVLGRIATEIALLLRGKAKPYFVHNLDCGDYVVVINASKVKVTGKKEDQKTYGRYSGYPGGLNIKTYSEVMKNNPTRIIKEAVSGMLPKNKLRDQFLKRLFVYKDDSHPYKNKL